MVYTPLRGRRKLEDTYLILFLFIPTPTQVTLMEVTHRDHIVVLSRAPFFMTQAMIKTGKLDPLLTHLHYIRQTLNQMIKPKTLRPLHTYIIMMIHNKHVGQTRTLKPLMNLCKIHHRDSDPFSTININRPTTKKVPRMNLVILEAVNTISILTPNTPRYTHINVCKNLF